MADLSGIDEVNSVTLVTYLTGVSSFNYNYEQNNFSFGKMVPDFCIVRSLQFVGTANNNSGAGASPAGGNTILIQSDLTGKLIGTLAPIWNPNASTPTFLVTCNASSNPENILDLRGRKNTVQNSFQFFTSSASTSSPFGITPITLTGQLSMTLDFIKCRK